MQGNARGVLQRNATARGKMLSYNYLYAPFFLELLYDQKDGVVHPVGLGGGGGEFPYKNDGSAPSYLLEVKICLLVLLTVLKSKVSTVRIIAVPFMVSNRRNMTSTEKKLSVN